MSQKLSNIAIEMVLVTILLFVSITHSDDNVPIPADKSQLNSWFDSNVGQLSARKASLLPDVASAEANVKVIKVRADGSGDFKTINDAVKSISIGNKNRVIVSIGPGNYTEKIKIERYKDFITFYGDPNNMPTVVYGDTAAKTGTMDSATLIVESDYFSAVNLKIKNSAPRPDGKTKDPMAAALRISGEFASFYNCKFYGFQDTLCDDKGKHFFKDCYVEGTVDFVFGSGQSLYLNSEIHVIPGDRMTFITAHARTKAEEPNGYVFSHCTVTGSGGTAYLGRAWFNHSRVVFVNSDLSDVVRPEGWFNGDPRHDKNIYFGEYNNKGAGSNLAKRAAFTKKLSDADVKPFISLAYIQASKWLLPPPKV
ncbi:hypothetical protein BUALT_Bualt06G0078500 [Buddleja alternifolia]|uniref:Pectinesterase n=1 Tax=Buddleja alternifolia TaxID=168488 RepID=A0AAV6XKK2_9LAMI|nr:hypothetical protein BUALT_Bualt06G0078500 [Buddleja alternifolia]